MQATHDTQGVIFQNTKADGAAPEPELAAPSTHAFRVTQKPWKRSYEGKPVHIRPYRRVPKAPTFSFSQYSAVEPESLQRAQILDKIWLLLSHLHPMTTPMWRGWNSTMFSDPLPVQNLGFMENIELPPTWLDVVNHILVISEKVRIECKEPYMLVGYDLAVAKPVMPIQEEEAPKFDKLFNALGPFHLRMSYFACIGYFIASSGYDEVICTSDVLGSGSLPGFLVGRYFNRCSRIHPLLFACLLHIQHFLSNNYREIYHKA